MSFVMACFPLSVCHHLSDHNLQLVHKCSPGKGVYIVWSRWRHLSYFRFHDLFNCVQCLLQVAPCVTVMSTGLRDAFSLKSLFIKIITVASLGF